MLQVIFIYVTCSGDSKKINILSNVVVKTRVDLEKERLFAKILQHSAESALMSEVYAISFPDLPCCCVTAFNAHFPCENVEVCTIIIMNNQLML